MLKETSRWTTQASVQQLQFCPSVADSWCGWQPVQAGCHEEYIMPEAVFEVIMQTYISLTNKAMPETGDAKPQ